jgi:hypothetical protein
MTVRPDGDRAMKFLVLHEKGAAVTHVDRERLKRLRM